MLDSRNVFLYIVTVPVDEAHGDMRSALTSRIACISLLIDDGKTMAEMNLVNPDERELLRQFWSLLKTTDVFIGYSVLNRGLRFIRERSWILNVRPTRRIDLSTATRDVFDLAMRWSFLNVEHTLREIAQACALSDGKNSEDPVQEWWNAGELAHIACACQENVQLVYRIFLRMVFSPLPERFQALNLDRCS